MEIPHPREMSNFRAKKAGLAMHIQIKLEEKYDEEDALGTPERVGQWMNKVLDGEHMTCTRYTWRNLCHWLRDGVALCKLVNKLRKHAGMTTVKFGCQNNLTAFIALENIATFNKAAQEYGIPETSLFQSVDLYECQKGPFLNVINCLNKLGFKANERGFEPMYEAIEPPTRDTDQWANT